MHDSVIAIEFDCWRSALALFLDLVGNYRIANDKVFAKLNPLQRTWLQRFVSTSAQKLPTDFVTGFTFLNRRQSRPWPDHQKQGQRY